MKEGRNPKISVIMPVYNAELYLEDCINSVRNQTYENIEIICINDGSSDNSYNILENFAQKDNRIILINQENSGPAKARNAGLKNAGGEYIMFLDADDSYEPGMCYEMLNTIISEDVNIVMCNTNAFGINYGDYYFRLPKGKHTIGTQEQLETNVFIWNKIFKKSLIDKYEITFPDGHKSDDNYLIYTYMTVAKTMYCLDKKLINHFSREGSIMDLYRNNLQYKDISDRIQIEDKLYDFLSKYDLYEKHADYHNERFYRELIWTWYNIPDIWIKRYLEELSSLLNKINLPRFHKENVKNRIIFQIKNNEYGVAKKNLDIMLARMHMSRKKYSVQDELYPNFEKNNIPIIFNCDSNFVKYLSVTLQSIIDNSSTDNNYDIIILNENISDGQKEILEYMLSKYPNFSIRFYNMEKLIKKYDIKSWFTTNHLNHTAYYRVFIPEIFENFGKVIYLDSDLILNTDIADLFKINLDGYAAGAVKDFLISKYEESDGILDIFKGLYSYLTQNLNMNNIENYFNSGVLLIDTPKMIRNNYFDKFIETGKINNKYMHDQNILNSVLEGDVKIIDKLWNAQLNSNKNPVLEEINWDNAKIIHFCSHQKPWTRVQDKGVLDILWWEYAKKSPFYDEIILSRLQPNFQDISRRLKSQAENSLEMSKLLVKKHRIKFNYYRVKFLHAITRGKTKEHYEFKKNLFKRQIRELRELAK